MRAMRSSRHSRGGGGWWGRRLRRPGTRTIGQGATPAIRMSIRFLIGSRGTLLLRDKQEYYDKVEKLLEALPPMGKPISITVVVSKDKLNNPGGAAKPIGGRFASMVMSQAGSC